jgi:ATP-dependent Zn protease
MSGGAGFSMDSNNRLKDNHKLGKIRENATYSGGKNDPNYRSKADSNSINESITHRFERKKELQRITWISLVGLVLVVLAFLFFLFVYPQLHQ